MEQKTATTPTTNQGADAVDGSAEALLQTPPVEGLSATGLTRLSISALVQYPWRRASLEVNRMIGRARRAADRPWMRPAWVPVLLVALALLLVWLAHTRVLSSWLPDQRDWLTPWKAVAAVGVLLLVGGMLRARTRMVVGNFVDSTGTEAQLRPGLGSLLVVELARLTRVCQAVDGKRIRPGVEAFQELHFEEDKSLDDLLDDPRPPMSPLPGASLQVGEDNQALRNAVAADTKVSAAGITVPIGAIINLFTALAQGPRLSGELHRVDGKLTLTARLSGGSGQLRTWRVDTDDTPETSRLAEPGPEALIPLLAVRVFTDLAKPGSSRWRAVHALFKGLTTYRNCLGATGDYQLKLLEVRKHLVEALAWDREWDLLYYDLGIVNNELGLLDAATDSFRHAIKYNQDHWPSYYALAELAYLSKRFSDVDRLCRRVLDLDPRNLQALHLSAIARRSNRDLAGTIDARRQAIRWGWPALCRATRRGDQATPTRDLIVLSLVNAGVYFCYQRYPHTKPANADESKPTPANADESKPTLAQKLSFQAALAELRLGTKVDRSDAKAQIELGKLYMKEGQWKRAVERLEAALQVDPENPRFHVFLAQAYAGQSRGEKVMACDQALEQPLELKDEDFDRLAKACPDRAVSLNNLKEWCSSWQRSELNVDELRARYHPPLDSDKDVDHVAWQAAMVALEFGRCLLDTSEPDDRQEAVKVLTAATKLFCESYPAEGRRRDVHALLARAHRGAEEYLAALEQAEIAVQQNPLSSSAHFEIAAASFALKEYDRAELSYREAIRCDPDDAKARLEYATAAASMALRCHDKGHRLELLETAGGLLQRAVDLCELRLSQDQPGNANGMEHPRPRPSNDLRGHKRIVHYWLGRVRYEQHCYQDAINQFVIARTLGEDSTPLAPLLGLYLGLAQLRIGVYARAQATFSRALELVHLTDDKVGCPTRIGPPGDEHLLTDVKALLTIHGWAARLELGDADQAKRALKELEEVAKPRRLLAPAKTDLPSEYRAVWEAYCGWAMFRTNDPRAIEDGIGLLEQSIRREPTPEGYLYLGQAHAELALTPAISKVSGDVVTAKACATVADELGMGQERVAHLRYLLSLAGRT
jgi:tetratricopeptide (TPR) repeat protein